MGLFKNYADFYFDYLSPIVAPLTYSLSVSTTNFKRWLTQTFSVICHNKII